MLAKRLICQFPLIFSCIENNSKHLTPLTCCSVSVTSLKKLGGYILKRVSWCSGNDTIHSLLCFRSGLWSGMSLCPIWLPRSGPPTCPLWRPPGRIWSTASSTGWRTTGTHQLKVSECDWTWTTCSTTAQDTVCLIVALVVVCLVRASKSGRAREVGGAAAVNARALYSNTQQKPSGEGQLKTIIYVKLCCYS